MSGVDWTQVLVLGVPAWIAAIGGARAAILTAQNRRSLHTSNGQSIAQAVESTHEIVTANTATLDTINDNTPTTP